MHRHLRRGATAAMLAFALPLADSVGHAQSATSADSAVRAIFTGRGLSGGVRFGPARWNADGNSYTTLEPSAQGTEIAEYDAATGQRRVRVTSRQLQPAGAATPLDIDDYAWSSDGKRLLVFTNTRKVWRQNTRGDYWVLDLASSMLHKVGSGAPEATLMFAKFSPDDSKVAYVRGGEIYVEPALGGKATRLTRDATRKVVNHSVSGGTKARSAPTWISGFSSSPGTARAGSSSPNSRTKANTPNARRIREDIIEGVSSRAM